MKGELIMLKRIESKEDMLQWSKEVNLVCKPGGMCDLQDIFARSAAKELKTYFIDMTQNEKELLVFSISKAMGSNTLFEFIKSYSNHRVQIQLNAESEENEKHWSAIVKKEMDFETMKQGYIKIGEKLTNQLTDIKNDNDTMQKTISDQWNEIQNKEHELEELSEENKRLTAFESHIKTLLNK